MNISNLNQQALDIRRKIFQIVCQNKAGHLASSLSSVEIMTTLYFGDILRYDSQNPNWEQRDRFILSKGHSALCLYSVLSKASYFPESDLSTFCNLGSNLGALPVRGKIPGVEATTGSLGHGFSFAAGIAKYSQVFQNPYHVYVLLGDGEMQEGEVWEAAMFSSSNRLNNLTAIIDNNQIQATGFTKDIINLSPLKDKLQSFGFEVIEVDGHNIKQLLSAFRAVSFEKPKAIIAHTIKGKGISYIENQSDWHYKMPTDSQIEIGCQELGLSRKELLI